MQANAWRQLENETAQNTRGFFSLDRVQVCIGIVCRRHGSTAPDKEVTSKWEKWLISKADVLK